MLPKVTVIVLNWNNVPDTIKCLESLFSSDYKNFIVIVVDNGSVDNPELEILSKYSSVRFIRNEKNLGFTGGMNIGIEAGILEGADYLWLLNNDARVNQDTITKIVGQAEADNQIGMVSPVVESENYTYWGTFLDITMQTRRNFVSIEELNSAKEASPQNICLWGTALLIKTEVIQKVGLLDDAFFAYFEDMDYSLRVISGGYKNVLCTDAFISHRKCKQSRINYPDHYHFYMARNEYLFWIKHLPAHQKATFRRKYISKMIRKSAGYLEAKAISAAHASLDGMWCALKNQNGERTSDQVMPARLKQLISSYPYFWSRLFSKR